MIEEKRTFICDLCGDTAVDLLPNLPPPDGWLVIPIKSKEGKPGKPPTIKRVLCPDCAVKFNAAFLVSITAHAQKPQVGNTDSQPPSPQ